MLTGWGLLLRRRSWPRTRTCHRTWRGFAGPAASAMFAMRDELLLPLDLFVQTHGHILDDGIGNFQTALEFLDQIALLTMQSEVDIKSLALLGHLICDPPCSESACVTVHTILVISSSGEVGIQMKFKSYKRPSIFPRFGPRRCT